MDEHRFEDERKVVLKWRRPGQISGEVEVHVYDHGEVGVRFSRVYPEWTEVKPRDAGMSFTADEMEQLRNTMDWAAAEARRVRPAASRVE